LNNIIWGITSSAILWPTLLVGCGMHIFNKESDFHCIRLGSTNNVKKIIINWGWEPNSSVQVKKKLSNFGNFLEVVEIPKLSP